MTPATFRHWRETMGFTRQDAAEALGYSIQRVKQWEQADKPAELSLSVRLAMTAVYHNHEPWK